MTIERDPLLLLAIATIAVTLLLWASSTSSDRVDGFIDTSAGMEIEVDCRIVDSWESDDGFILTLQDRNGMEMRAFTHDLSPGPGEVVRVRGTVSSDGGIIFIDSIARLGQTY